MNEELNEILERIGFGRYQYWIYLVAGSVSSRQGWFNDMAGIYITTVFLASAGDEWNLSETERGIIGSIYMLGMITGSVVCGTYSDKRGRRRTFQATILLFGISLCFTIVSVNAYMASIGLFFFGFSVGAEVVVAAAVFQEFCPPSKQHLLTRLAVTWCIASASTVLLAAAFESSDLPISVWKMICLYGIFTSITFFILRIKLQETPRFLALHGKTTEAENLLGEMAAYNRKEIDISLIGQPLLDSEVSSEHVDTKKIGGFAEIWKRRHLRTTVIFSITFFISDVTFVFINFFMPELLKNIGITGVKNYLTIAIQQTCGIPGILLSSYLVDTRLGRKYTIALGMIVSGIVNLALILAEEYWELLLFTSLFNTFNYMGFAVLFTIAPESYTTDVRTTGVGWAHAMAKFGGLVGPLLGGITLDLPNGFEISIAIACSMAVILGLISTLMKETRGIKVQ